jgi:hypothetical protein
MDVVNVTPIKNAYKLYYRAVDLNRGIGLCGGAQKIIFTVVMCASVQRQMVVSVALKTAKGGGKEEEAE